MCTPRTKPNSYSHAHVHNALVQVDGGDSDNGSLNSLNSSVNGSSDSNSSNGNNGQRPRGNSGEGRSTSPETSISSGDMAWGDNSGQNDVCQILEENEKDAGV